jgi:multiple sugar transport system permease protein
MMTSEVKAKLNKQRISIDAKSVIWSIVITCLGLIMIIPFIWMISAALKRPLDVFEYPIRWIPKYWYPQNFITVWNPKNNMLLAYANSAKISIIITVGAVLNSALAGYAFARINFRHRNKIFLLYLATMMIPTQVTMIPKFIMFDFLKLLNTHNALILPGLFTALGTFLLRQAYLQVPKELSEAAKMDGANELTIWGRIITPLIKSSLASLALLVFMGNWNNYEEPLIFLTSRKLFTIPLSLNTFMDEHIADYSLVMAASVSALLPVIVVFAIGQKYFVKGLTEGAVKG